jgi:hypothetical protein
MAKASKTSKKALEFRSKAGKIFKDSPLYKGDAKNADYSKPVGRQSKNVQDVSDRLSKAYKKADAKGALDEKAMHQSSQTEDREIKHASPEGLRHRNIFLNRMKQRSPKSTALRLKNKKLDAPKQVGFYKKEKKKK